MCGICGKMRFDGAPVDRESVARMCQTIIHRGPDGEGIYTAPGIGLGQRRLAVIDLRPSGVAPLANEDETVWVTFNGEIYNFVEIRDRLRQRGHTFKTETDTEVIVHLYEEYGTNCVTHMHGMFAFALWDAKKQQIFAARDRLGKKPFFFSKTNGAFLFGSEIKAITADPDVSVQPDYAAIDSYLTLQYVPSPRSAFAGIHKLQPGHWLRCDRSGQVEIQQYWAAPRPPKTDMTERDIEAEIITRLREAVRTRLQADVPVGAFLSGGIDSGVIVALMAECSDRPVKTFSIGSEDATRDELPYAKLVAERYGTEHHELVVRPDAAAVLPLLVQHYNEPFADSSAIPTYYVSRLTREHVTVALTGDGGDESFAGYSSYAAVTRWERADAIPHALRHMPARAVGGVLDALPYANSTARLSRAMTMLGGDVVERFRLQLMFMKPQEQEECYTPLFRDLIAQSGGGVDPLVHLPRLEGEDPLDWMMRHDQSFYLPDCLMTKTDVASMANSLEVRCPLLDDRFVEFAASIPSSMKYDGQRGKVIFRNAARSLLPDAIINKPKTGFSMPIAAWLRSDLYPLLRDTLLDERAMNRGLFRREFVNRMVTEHRDGARDWSNRLWAFLFLELWFREFID